ncbi:MAG: AAA family ATPase [Lachnospiraceae bacterium]|nr:AAA family ATPase [Lachnospiraceae bacterium]
MSDGFMDAMNSIGGGSEYTLEELRKAERLKKRHGGTIAENLVKVTGRSPGSSMSLDFASMNRQLQNNHDILDRQIRELNENIARDFGIDPAAAGRTAVSAEAGAAGTSFAEKSTGDSGEILQGEDALEQFNGLNEELGKKVFGQDEFIKKLIIAFKRPFVMPPGDKKARNTLFITGPADTGRHLGLIELAKLLKARRILKTDDIKRVDLGLYTEPAHEAVFLQDIYSALSSSAGIILFENFENCHPSFLNQVSSLVTDGTMKLSGRYVMQKGQLVSVQNALATETVSEFTANDKYLVFLTGKSLDKAAGVMGAPFIDALRGDVCVTSGLDEASAEKIALERQGILKEKASSQFSFDVSFDEGFTGYAVSKKGRSDGITGVLDFYDDVEEALAQARLEGDYEKNARVVLSAEDGSVFASFGDSRIDLRSFMPEVYKGEIDEIKKELDQIIGLTEIKEYVLGLEEYYKVQKRRQEEGLKSSEVNKHMIFTGSPGTGKTTIARIISKYLKAIGVLTGGQLVEVSRGDLVGRYVGHTAPLTNQVIKSAIGGVLFIDEAYSLYRGKDDSYGLEAIDTLVKGIEDNRDNLIVILAGYSREMQEFLTSNSGLKSRFPNIINFPDYTGKELLQIAQTIAVSKGYQIDEGAHDALRAHFDLVQITRAADAGNGRYARNMVEEAILNQSKRLVAEPDAPLSVLMREDFELGEIPDPVVITGDTEDSNSDGEQE